MSRIVFIIAVALLFGVSWAEGGDEAKPDGDEEKIETAAHSYLMHRTTETIERDDWVRGREVNHDRSFKYIPFRIDLFLESEQDDVRRFKVRIVALGIGTEDRFIASKNRKDPYETVIEVNKDGRLVRCRVTKDGAVARHRQDFVFEILSMIIPPVDAEVKILEAKDVTAFQGRPCISQQVAGGMNFLNKKSRMSYGGWGEHISESEIGETKRVTTKKYHWFMADD